MSTDFSKHLPSPRFANLGVDEAIAFTREQSPGILFVPGEPSRPEVIDVAIVLRELSQAHPNLRLGFAPAGQEPAMKRELGLSVFPALVFVRGGAVVKTITRMQSWSKYAEAARELEVAS